MPNLHTLPKELQLQVAEYLSLKADLKNLCLVSKEMRDVAMPVLYKDMVIHVDKLNSDFQQVIKTTKNHLGLPHIRTLRVTNERERWNDPVVFARFRAVAQLVSAMPTDTLTHFQLPQLTSLSDNLNRLLRSRQRKLVNYECHTIPRDRIRAFPKPPGGDELSSVTMLHFYIQFKHDCKRAATILMNAPRVTSVAVTQACTHLAFRFMNIPEEAESGRAIVDLLFRPAYENRAQLKLKTLRFYGICLEKAGDLVREFILLEDLQHLQLLRCNYIYPFLEAVTQRYSDLQTLVLKHCRGGRRISPITSFLRAATPKRLVVRLLQAEGPYSDGKGSVAFDTLLPTAHAIQCLVLDDSIPRHYVSSRQRREGSSTSFLDLCKSLQSLQQLCVVSPIVSRTFGQRGAFLELLDHLKYLKELRVLNLVFDSSSNHHTEETYQEAADKVFETLIPSCPQLSAVVFEERVNMDPLTWSFVRPDPSTRQARAKCLGVDVAPRVIRAHEPRSDMLEPEGLIFS